MHSSKHEVLICSVRKNFSNVFKTISLLLKACLGPWVSAKLNGVAVRRVKHFFSQYTCGGGDFPCFEIVSKVFVIITQKSLVKNFLLANNKGNVLRRVKTF